MDVQLKRGILEAAVLCTLMKEESYGYQIIKELSEHVEISESTLYPILRRLEAAGALAVRSEAYNGRLRKYYATTPEGRARVLEFLNEWKSVMELYTYMEAKVNDQ